MEKQGISEKDRMNLLARKSSAGKYLRTIFPLLGLIAMIIIFSVLTHGRLTTPRNIMLILDQSYVLLIAATGVFFIMAIGGLDFSQGSIVGLASIAVAYLAHYSYLAAILGGIAVGFGIGVINGFFHVKMKIPSFIVTICTMFLFRGLCKYFTTGSPVKAPLSMGNLDSVYMKLPIVLTIIALAWFLSYHTRLGTIVRSVGAGETAARFSGIQTERIKFLVFVIAGCLTGFAAFLNVVKVGSVTATGGNMVETNILIAMVLGGMPVQGGAKSRYLSVIVGCLIFAVMSNGLVMLQLEPSIQQLIRGLIFLGVVAATIDRKSSIVIK